ncbi:MAG: arabinose efflux permease family protein [Candidatus Saccharibacteria bacterium]|nr:arabinose efflux permease family protein [Candidatus Saccharibacteria bacterium]
MKRRPPRVTPPPEALSVVRNSNFTKLWSAQILSQIATHLLNFALIIRVFDLAEGTRVANMSVALLILSFGIPSIFFAAAAGVYVDHWNKKRVLVAANIIRAVLVLGYLIFEQNLAMVLLLSFVISATTQFFAPAESAAIPALVSPKQLLRANSLFVFTLYASFVVGYSLSAPVIAAFGDAGPYWLTATMFLFAGISCWFLPSIHVRESQGMPFKQIVKYTGREILNNWRVIRANHNLSFPITQLTITQASLGVILALAPALSVAVLGEPLRNSSHFLIIPAGIGMVLGVALIGRLVQSYTKTTLVAVGLIVAASALVLLGMSNTLYHQVEGRWLGRFAEVGVLVAGLVLILGFMNSLVSAASQTILQENTTDATRGKVFGALNMMINIAATLPVFFAGILADLTSVNLVVTVLGLMLLIFAILQYFWMRTHNKLA